ncbi:MAG: efflux RND transporter periplasmic adaptor subunit [Flavobacteriales bacterium]|nr:efflux RND transporter periplasmic adaptor subunit [Flavobacteriales bacterium]
MTVQTVVLQPRPLDHVLIATGTLLANEEVELVCETAGRVTHIGFEEGATVAAGQVLLRINDDDLQAELRQVEANLRLARDDEQRKEQLMAVSGISREAFDASHAARVALEAQADVLKARIARTVMRAPFRGAVGLRQVSPGAYLAPGTSIAHLRQLSPIKIEFALPERSGRGIKPGARVTFTLEGDHTVYEAQVYAVEPGVDATNRTVQVRARHPNTDGRLVPGAFARVEVALERIPDALTVPTEALMPDIQGQKVFVLRNGRVTSQRVDVGIRLPKAVQLSNGAQPGDTVLVTGLLAVREGMPVRAIPMGDQPPLNGEPEEAAEPR